MTAIGSELEASVTRAAMQPVLLLTAATQRAGALKEACASPGGARLRLVEDLAALGRETGAELVPLLVPVTAPVRFVAARLGQGAAPAAALGEWVDATSGIRALGKSRRRRVALVDDRALVAPDAGLRAALVARLGQDIPLPALPAAVPPNLSLCAAALALLQTAPDLAGILAIWQEEVLGARDIGLRFSDAQGAVHIWQQLQAGHDDAEVLALREAQAVMQEITSSQVDQIEAATRQIADLESRQVKDAASPSEVAVLRASIEALERRLADAAALRLGAEAALGAQILADGAALRAEEEEPGRIRAELDRLRHEAGMAREELAAARRELDTIYASKSWRLTEILRGTRRSLGR